jgi:hypothetical protein
VFDKLILIIIIKICLRIKIMTTLKTTNGQLTKNPRTMTEANMFNWKDFPSSIDLHLSAREPMAKFTRE